MWYPAVLVVTEYLEELLRPRDLRGEVWALSKAGGKDRGNPVEGICVERLDPAKMRQPFDVKPVLLRLYHVADIPLGIPNPVEPKILLEPSPDAPPAGWVAAAPKEDAPASPEEIAAFRAKLAEFGGRKGAKKPVGKPSVNGTNGAH